MDARIKQFWGVLLEAGCRLVPGAKTGKKHPVFGWNMGMPGATKQGQPPKGVVLSLDDAVSRFENGERIHVVMGGNIGVVDCDTAIPGGNPEANDRIEAYYPDGGKRAVVATKRGFHHYFKVPDTFRQSQGRADFPGIDTRAPGKGQVVAPGNPNYALFDNAEIPDIPDMMMRYLFGPVSDFGKTIGYVGVRKGSRTGMMKLILEWYYKTGYTKTDALPEIRAKCEEQFETCEGFDWGQLPRYWDWCVSHRNKRRPKEMTVNEAIRNGKADAPFDFALLANAYRVEEQAKNGSEILPHPTASKRLAVFVMRDDETDTVSEDRAGMWYSVGFDAVKHDFVKAASDIRDRFYPKNALSNTMVNGAITDILGETEGRLFPLSPTPQWHLGERVVAFPNGMVLDFDSDDACDLDISLEDAMRFERLNDFILNRTVIVPRDMPTPVYDAFMRETAQDAKGNVRDDFAKDLEGTLARCLLRQPRQRILVWVGEGSNGKGTLLSLWREVLGQNYYSVGREWAGGTNFWKAQLENRTLVVFDDTVDGSKFPWLMLKEISGAEVVTAGGKNMPERMFETRNTTIVTSNNLPEAARLDTAKVRRLVIFNFLFNAKESKKGEDPSLSNRLREEAPGVLYRHLNLAREIYAQGNLDPLASEMGASVKMDTAKINKKISVVDRFLDEVCDFEDADAVIRQSAIWTAHKEWAAANNMKPAKQGQVYAAIRAALAVEGPTGNKKDGNSPSYRGIRLLTDETQNPPPEPEAVPPEEAERLVFG